MLKTIQQKCASIRKLCDDKYLSLPCIRDYLHDLSLEDELKQINPSVILDDSHEFCITSALCKETDVIVQRALEGA